MMRMRKDVKKTKKTTIITNTKHHYEENDTEQKNQNNERRKRGSEENRGRGKEKDAYDLQLDKVDSLFTVTHELIASRQDQ